jgi:hypothetical protein
MKALKSKATNTPPIKPIDDPISSVKTNVDITIMRDSVKTISSLKPRSEKPLPAIHLTTHD